MLQYYMYFIYSNIFMKKC